MASTVVQVAHARRPLTAPRSLHGRPGAARADRDGSKAGDRDALDALTRLIRPHVERQLARYPVSDDDRLDLVQSTLLQVVRRIRLVPRRLELHHLALPGDGERGADADALAAAAARAPRRGPRSRGSLGAAPTCVRAPAEDDAASLAEREAHVRHALGELPDDYRDVVARALPRRPRACTEIAEKLMVSESAVRSRLHRARVRLRAILNAARPSGASSPNAAA